MTQIFVITNWFQSISWRHPNNNITTRYGRAWIPLKLSAIWGGNNLDKEMKKLFPSTRTLARRQKRGRVEGKKEKKKYLLESPKKQIKKKC